MYICAKLHCNSNSPGRLCEAGDAAWGVVLDSKAVIRMLEDLDSNCVFILPGLSDRLNVWELLLERDERSNQHRRIGVAKTWFNYHADGVVVWHGTNARHQNGIAFSNGSMHDISNIKKTIKSRKPFLFR